ncbi:MAG: SDR family oxidoreductase [Paludibacter sp.]|jgi:short-subunit dehydrogenase|nr:SDR family oxidoreductase [Paludibacter sp.]
MKVKNKTIVVTGAGNGVGRELVINLLEKGARVIAVDMNKNALDETFRMSEQNSDRLMTHVANITDKKAIENLLEKALKTFSSVDGIINNAGIIQPFVKLNELDETEIERIMNVNFQGTLNMIKIFLPHLLTRPEAHIVNISSMGGFLPVAGQLVYGASKAAVKSLSEGLRSELSDTAVHVTTVVPGAINTNIKINSGLIKVAESTDAEKAKKTLHPTIAAEKTVKAIEHNCPQIYLGKDSKTMNWIYKFSPKLATQLIYNKVKYKFEK